MSTNYRKQINIPSSSFRKSSLPLSGRISEYVELFGAVIRYRNTITQITTIV